MSETKSPVAGSPRAQTAEPEPAIWICDNPECGQTSRMRRRTKCVQCGYPMVGYVKDPRQALSASPGSPLEEQEKAVTLLLSVLPVSEKHGHCFCDGPDRIGVHLDWCPARVLFRFREAIAQLKSASPGSPWRGGVMSESPSAAPLRRGRQQKEHEDVQAIMRVVHQLVRECTTSWPVEPIYACRVCHVTLERGGKPTNIEHNATCIVSILTESLTEPDVVGRSLPPLRDEQGGPIPLNEGQERAAKEWAADDRLWTTQETVEFNLRTFARVILKHSAADVQVDGLRHQIQALEGEMRKALRESDASEKGGGGYWIRTPVYNTIKQWANRLSRLIGGHDQP